MQTPPPLIPPPSVVSLPPLIPGPKPRVVLYYRLWCALLVALYLGIGVYELLVYRGHIEPDLGLFTEMVVKHDQAMKKQAVAEAREDALGGAFVAGGGAIFYAIAVLVPRRRWGWTLGTIALALSFFPFMLTVAGMIPLLVFWLKPETKRYFSG
jgi:hypothetical protein